MSFEQKLQAKVAEVERILKGMGPVAKGHQKNMMKIMEYSLMSGGKRIRPILMKESFLLFGGVSHVIEFFMASIEMIHTYSLVHDDLPAMDNDEYRRGRKTTHIVYGEDMGILAGDALLNYAYELAISTLWIFPDHIVSNQNISDPGSIRIGQALRVLSEKAGIFGMIGGQVIDIESTGTKISEEVLNEIYLLKTAALMEASMMIGGILGGASKEEVKILESIARNIGIAFQIQDDILDVTSTLDVLGKPTHSDEKNQKTTYVTLHGIEKAKEDVKDFSNQAINQLETLNREHSFLKELLLFLIYRKF